MNQFKILLWASVVILFSSTVFGSDSDCVDNNRTQQGTEVIVDGTCADPVPLPYPDRPDCGDDKKLVQGNDNNCTNGIEALDPGPYPPRIECPPGKAVDQGTGECSIDVPIPNTCITHNGTEYCEVVSPYTGKVWLDRNLGADQVCTAFNDTACYGDYYQWGRNTDGHQDSGSGTTSTQAADVNNAGSDFITSSSANDFDWAIAADGSGSQRSTNWSKTDSSSVCPAGFRVPTIVELRADTLDNGVTNRDTAFSSFLKLPSAGSRGYSAGSMHDVGSGGGAFSSSTSGSHPSNLYFNSGNAVWGSNGYRAVGLSVRCIKGPLMIIDDNFDSDAVGTTPSDWTIKYNGTGDANQKVVDIVYQSYGHSFQLEGQANWSAYAYKTPSSIPDFVTLESNIYIEKIISSYSGSVGLSDINSDTWGILVGGLVYKDGKYYAYYDGGNFYEISNFIPQQWYHIQIIYNNTAKTYQIYIDENLVSGSYGGISYSEFPMHPTVNPVQVTLAAGNGATVKVFYDDVKMY